MIFPTSFGIINSAPKTKKLWYSVQHLQSECSTNNSFKGSAQLSSTHPLFSLQYLKQLLQSI